MSDYTQCPHFDWAYDTEGYCLLTKGHPDGLQWCSGGCGEEGDEPYEDDYHPVDYYEPGEPRTRWENIRYRVRDFLSRLWWRVVGIFRKGGSDDDTPF